MRFIYWRAETVGVPRIWAAGVPTGALLWGIGGGLAAALAGLADLAIADAFDLIPRDAGSIPAGHAARWLAAIAIAAARRVRGIHFPRPDFWCAHTAVLGLQWRVL
jgi:hypothetical protein